MKNKVIAVRISDEEWDSGLKSIEENSLSNLWRELDILNRVERARSHRSVEVINKKFSANFPQEFDEDRKELVQMYNLISAFPKLDRTERGRYERNCIKYLDYILFHPKYNQLEEKIGPDAAQMRLVAFNLLGYIILSPGLIQKEMAKDLLEKAINHYLFVDKFFYECKISGFVALSSIYYTIFPGIISKSMLSFTRNYMAFLNKLDQSATGVNQMLKNKMILQNILGHYYKFREHFRVEKGLIDPDMLLWKNVAGLAKEEKIIFLNEHPNYFNKNLTQLIELVRDIFD